MVYWQPQFFLQQECAKRSTASFVLTLFVLFSQGGVRSGAGDFKGAVAAYKRAAAEAPELDLSLLQGLAEALVSDGRPQEAAEYLLEQRKLAEAGTGVDAVNLELLLGRVSCVFCNISTEMCQL